MKYCRMKNEKDKIREGSKFGWKKRKMEIEQKGKQWRTTAVTEQ
jgi:hypothetical protein